MAQPDSPYIDPKTGVFYNKLGIRDAAELREIEYKTTAVRVDQLNSKPISGKFDMAHLSAIHKHIFQDVYEWAGQQRTVNISKGDSHFCRCSMLDSYMEDINKRLVKDNYLRGLDKPEFVNKFTEFYGDVNALHPFREGNGRSTQTFITQLAKQAGYQLDLSQIAQNKDRWNLAAAQTITGKIDDMRSIFSEALSPSRQEQYAPRHDMAKNPAEMDAAARARIGENIEALKKNPALADRTPEALAMLAYWRGITAERFKDAPDERNAALAKFDKAVENPAILEKLEKSGQQPQEQETRAEPSRAQEREDYGLER